MCENFDEMQIVFKAITGSFGHAPFTPLGWKEIRHTVRAREKSVMMELVTASIHAVNVAKHDERYGPSIEA